MNPGSRPLVSGEVIDLLARAELKGVKEDVHNLAVKVDGLASKGDIAALTHSIGAIADKQDRLQTPQYGLIVSIASFLFFLLTAIGGFAYLPVQRDLTRLDTALAVLVDKGVFAKQYDSDQARIAELVRSLRADVNITIQQQRYNTDMARIASDLARLSDNNITRKEFEVQHHDLQTVIAERFLAVVGRVNRLENLHIK